MKSGLPITLRVGLSENGYDVEVAYDGRLGYQLFQSRPFNLVVLDINLPVFSGYELCKMIRSNNNNIPIIMLTALSSLQDKIEGMMLVLTTILSSRLSLGNY